MNTPTARAVEETQMIATWFDEAALEIAVNTSTIPPPVLAVMKARFDQNFNEMVYRVGVPHAVALFAAVAFAAGRKAERAGLVHEPAQEI